MFPFIEEMLTNYEDKWKTDIYKIWEQLTLISVYG